MECGCGREGAQWDSAGGPCGGIAGRGRWSTGRRPAASNSASGYTHAGCDNDGRVVGDDERRR
jgi:hypothetical protein